MSLMSIFIKVIVVSLKEFSLKRKKFWKNLKFLRTSEHQHFTSGDFKSLSLIKTFSFQLESSTILLENSSFSSNLSYKLSQSLGSFQNFSQFFHSHFYPTFLYHFYHFYCEEFIQTFNNLLRTICNDNFFHSTVN